jgi:hypothetical protein
MQLNITTIRYSKTQSTVHGKNETFTIEAAVPANADIQEAFKTLKAKMETIGDREIRKDHQSEKH